MFETILAEKTEAGVGIIRLNRPQALNALNSTLMAELGTALQTHDQDADIGCHLIIGNDKAFAAGADIKDMAAASVADIVGRDFSIWERIGKLTKPLVAAVSGYCLGGGCELALACDIIIASETAQFGQPEINLGIIPGGGGTQRLTRAVGKFIAMEMVLNDRRLSAEEAWRYGLANHVFSVETYAAEAQRLAGEIAARAPLARQMAKQAVNMADEMPLAAGLAFEQRAFHLLFGTDDQSEGMQAFIEKRSAHWQGR
ncbi:MAG: enoyl-CoA hydratase-related protein [Anaerolineales bacterium]